ncbi:MAG: tRNA (adenosine(37)-N6)-threonylcarbamoyltransferase complex ATPase subunit type 1 TsaE [Planctomycetales bacterium]|nr:tRNA (adenosine(37)-N6)-threonylcarbamoyltransferase complex ATPase subunit type 1 TsaE [Planctomycetales bacterium]NIM09154.1 tRNA (adenosine(37)-N6)-threonylcarbamoyltransferase complex ATPase subunit type 1 TsaE [Planctomycetales bacterium]NIN08621.1 tRNA (adenosine(37)-N6)-threonylcarbamoyltransferase complex ATPase subunit type 1 TsaE [Planctomycetales bacterium]NIN77747.1 tRNA (adenosine(37)-N6)-threonylcarbamoyltransferase complex ATPase subunit type 1 TsaE [Planctomycetales bacterium]
MGSQLTFHAQDEADTCRLGEALAQALPSGTVVGLIGPLGAGKTRLVQAVAQALGVDVRDVVSPTFVMIREYQGQRPVYHFDAYRLSDLDEFFELGPGEYFHGAGLTFVEWADRVTEALPDQRLEIEITVTGESTREMQLRAWGTPLESALHAIAELLADRRPDA